MCTSILHEIENKKILITGATGLIGQNIINAKFEDRGINEQGHNMALISLLLICKITGFC